LPYLDIWLAKVSVTKAAKTRFLQRRIKFIILSLNFKGQMLHWEEHVHTCLPNKRNILSLDSIYDLIKEEIRNLNINDKKYRYKKRYLFNRKQNMIRVSKTNILEQEHELYIKSLIIDREKERFVGSKLLSDPEVALEKILKKADQAIAKNNPQGTFQYFSLAIDKMILDKSIDQMNKEQLTNLAQIYYKRSYNQIEFGRLFYDEYSLDQGIKNSEFVLKTLNDSDRELLKKFTTLSAKASYRRIFITRKNEEGGHR